MRNVDRRSVRRRGFWGDHDLRGALVLTQADNLRVLHAAQPLKLVRGVQEGRERGLILRRGIVRSVCGGVYYLGGRGNLRLGLGRGLVRLRLLRGCVLRRNILWCNVLWCSALGRGLRIWCGGWFGLGLGVDERGEGAGLRVDRVGIDHGEEGAVDAGAEALRHDIGGLALGGIGIGGGIGRKGELHVEHRRGHRAQGEDDQRHGQAGDLLDQAHPAVAHGGPAAALALAGRVAGHAGNAAVEGLIAQQTKHRGDERKRDQHGDGDGAGGGQAHCRQEANARNEKRKKRSKDGRAGKDHGGASRAHRHACGIWPVHAATLGAVARQDKQRIVNAHGKANHDGQDRGHIIELNPVGGNEHAQRA